MSLGFDFLKANYFTTSSVASVGSNTSTVSNMIDRNTTTTYETLGFPSTTATTLIVTPNTASVISRIVLINHNLKSFRIYYNSLTSNTFTLDADYDTVATLWTGNSATSHYLITSSITVASLHIQMTAATAADTEKFIGELYIGQEHILLTRNPDASRYKPKENEKNFLHEMSDGGIVRYHLANKYEATIDFDFVSEADRTTFRTIYDTNAPFDFTPFPKKTGWDERIYEVNWTNGFDFFQLQSNVLANGFKGKIQLRETPNR